MKKYNEFINEYKKLNESNDFINEIDPYNEEDWDEIDRGYDDDDNDDCVIDYYGNEIDGDDAIMIGNEYFSINDVLWSNYHDEYFSPEDDNVVWVEYDGGDHIYKDEAKYSKKYDEYFHPDDDNIIYINSRDDWIFGDDTVYSERDEEHLFIDDAQWCKYEQDYCLEAESIELENGDYSFSENVKKDYKGDNYHKDTLKWNDDKNGYVYIE